jgi:hypothetical protein
MIVWSQGHRWKRPPSLRGGALEGRCSNSTPFLPQILPALSVSTIVLDGRLVNNEARQHGGRLARHQ